MKWYVKPFALIHKIVGAVIVAILGTTFFLGIAGLVIGVLGLFLAALGYTALWGILFFICATIGWSLIGMIRLIDPSYAKNKKSATDNVAEKVTELTGDLRTMAKDHL